MNLTLVAVLCLGGIGLFLAIILYWASQKFQVFEDPRLEEVEASLPGANCGACGFAGCRNFAEECIRSEHLETLLCPVGGLETMAKIATILGKVADISEPKISVLRCNGSCAYRPKTSVYDGATSCAIAAATFGGDTNCSFGCVGLADCVAVCSFDALTMNTVTGLPEVDEVKCTSCGLCLKACPKGLFELRFKGTESQRIYVKCMNKDKGAVAKKSCSVACIGCGKCENICETGAITLSAHLAYIDFNTCILCRKCVDICPTNAIAKVNFPARQRKEETIVSV